MEIHHIGYLVKNIDKAKEIFESLGYLIEKDTMYDDIRDINICFMCNGEYRIELVSPQSKDSVVSDTIKKMGETPYHICYYVDDIKKAMESLRAHGFIPTSEIQPAPAINRKQVCFMYKRNMGLLELVER